MWVWCGVKATSKRWDCCVDKAITRIFADWVGENVMSWHYVPFPRRAGLGEPRYKVVWASARASKSVPVTYA
ncbi:hypothetical protein CDL15_Pgr004057 [Punica granatum]|uniref:Uncharacterized protein n=1 Tax=Punica granatum TaxID=22663 RepID=A0A218XFQ5_PUNGR|nr:hypothetical protein CDL15_Pgr004057 [Punica granatum]